MKKNVLFFALCAAFAVTTAFVAGNTIVGHWSVSYGDGSHGYAVFNKDGSCEATFTGQSWKVGGSYKEKSNTLSITDSICGFKYWASYKTTWYSDDSMQVVVIEDTCSGRKRSIDGSVLVRMK